MNHEEFETAGESPESSEAARIRALFRQSAPRGEPVDLERLLLTASGRAPRRSIFWRRLVAAALLLFSGVAVGWMFAREGAREEMARLESDVSVQLRALRAEVVDELSGALNRYSEELLEAQQDGMKKVAILLRNDYRPRLARLRSQVEGLLLAMEHPVRLPRRDR